MTKASLLVGLSEPIMTHWLMASQHLLAFSIAVGPVLWLLKLSLFCFVLRHFGSVRWVKNCAYMGIIVLGLVFSAYTIIVTISCGPVPGSDTASYLRGLGQKQCSAPEGVTAVSSKANPGATSNVLLQNDCELPLKWRLHILCNKI
jgi:hypothetical protein